MVTPLFPYRFFPLIYVRLKALENVDVQKLQAMERWDKDTHDAVVWVRNNRDKFRMEVFETPFMRLNVKDKRFIHAIDACFTANQMRVTSTSFVMNDRAEGDLNQRLLSLNAKKM